MIAPKKISYVIGIAVGVFVFLWMARQIIAKYHFEKINRNVEICVELAQIKKICKKYQYPLENCLERIRTIGVASLVVEEESFDSLQDDGRIIYFSLADFKKLHLLDLVAPYAAVSPETVLIQKRRLAKKLINVVKEKTKYNIKPKIISGYTMIKIKDMGLLKKIGWGFDDEKLLLTGRYKFKVILKLHRAQVPWVPSQLPENLSCVIFNGQFDEKILQNLKLQNVKIPIFEFSVDRSMLDSLKKIPYCAVRAHRIEWRSRTKPVQLLLDRWRRAARERNCRLLYFDFIESLGIEDNLDYLRELCNVLRKERYILTAVDVPKLSSNKFISIPPSVSNTISFFIAIFIPVFSLGYIWKHIKESKNPTINRTFSNFYLLSAVNLSAGIFINTLLSNYQFHVKLYEFRHIKFTFLLPFIFVILILYSKEQLKKIWHKNIQTRDVLIGAIFLLTVAIVIIRSGNYPVLHISELELKLRLLLENMFIFRPRFKEFLFGHPLLILGLWSKSRFLLILGMVGQVSIINTFLHVHTPIDVSLLRSFYGLLLGSILGLILIIIGKKLKKYW